MPDLKIPDLNSVTVVGRLTRDPELRNLASGSTVCELGIANDTGFGDKKKTNWLNVVTWNKSAEWCAANLKKGAPILVEGRIETDEYETKAGEKRTKTKITAHRVQSLSWPDGRDGTGQQRTTSAGPNEEIPF